MDGPSREQAPAMYCRFAKGHCFLLRFLHDTTTHPLQMLRFKNNHFSRKNLTKKTWSRQRHKSDKCYNWSRHPAWEQDETRILEWNAWWDRKIYLKELQTFFICENFILLRVQYRKILLPIHYNVQTSESTWSNSSKEYLNVQTSESKRATALKHPRKAVLRTWQPCRWNWALCKQILRA